MRPRTRRSTTIGRSGSCPRSRRCSRSPDGAALLSDHPRWAVVAAARAEIAERRAELRRDHGAASDIADGQASVEIGGPALAARVERVPAPVAAPGDQRHRRGAAHQPRPRAARGARRWRASQEVARGYSNLEYDPDERRARVASRARRGALVELTGAEARCGGQQQRRRGAADAGGRWPAGARRSSRAARWSRSAARSASPTSCARPASRCARSAPPTRRGSPTTTGAAGADDGAVAEGAPLELRRRRLHRGGRRRGARRGGPRARHPDDDRSRVGRRWMDLRSRWGLSGERADGARAAARRRRSVHVLGRQAARRAAGRPDRRQGARSSTRCARTR